MPAPGGANNGNGINSFSGPMGQKEAAYGTAETMKVLGRIGVTNPHAVSAPQRAKRNAGRRSKPAPTQAAPEPQIAAESAPVASYDQQMVQFWTQLAAEPGASPLIQQMAQKAVSGSA